MKLLELEIKNIRGVRGLTLSPNGENVVVWGPNGSGKSAVVDAIDFLLTGRISRLTGEGTGGIYLTKHGPHILSDPADAVVSATVEIPGIDKPVKLKRKLSNPDVIEATEETAQALEPIFELASRNQHALSRRDILRFITAEKSKRGKDVQALLHLSHIEETRKSLKGAFNTSRTKYNNAVTAKKTAQNWVANALSLMSFDTDEILASVNDHRSTLGGSPLAEFRVGELKSGITSPAEAVKTQAAINPTFVNKATTGLSTLLAIKTETGQTPDQQLRALLQAVRKDEEATRALAKLKLLEYGLDQVDETGSCPLCGTAFPPGALKGALEKQVLDAKALKEKQKEIEKLSGTLATQTSTAIGYVQDLIKASEALKMTDDVNSLTTWEVDLATFVEDLSDCISKYPRDTHTIERIAAFLAPSDASEIAKRILTASQAQSPKLSPEQLSWDTLTRLEEHWKTYQAAILDEQRDSMLHQRAHILYDAFKNARDTVLANLFESVEGRFSDLYRIIHEDDEGSFNSTFRPEEAGVKFEVDFYGQGMHPPHALHSEGHQDTMGLCLYLALAEALTSGIVQLTILDDVIMSVDSDHRRNICTLLREQFPQRQFLITTHDRMWARELEMEGVVKRKHVTEFTRWTIESGPFVTKETDMWSQIDKGIAENNVASAAHAMRRGLEQFFEIACDNIKAPIPYRSDGRYTLADYAQAAINRYRRLLGKGKAAAQSWGKQDEFDRITELETVFDQICKRARSEQWAVNAQVHFNKLGEMSPKEFQPVADAMRDLYEAFKCPNVDCQGIVALSLVENKPVGLICGCRRVDIHLSRKGEQ